MSGDKARLAALVVAVAIPVIGWIGFAYLSQTHIAPRDTASGQRIAVAPAPNEHGNGDGFASEQRQITTLPGAPENDIGQRQHSHAPVLPDAIYKCRVQGQSVYSDLPCAPGSAIKILVPQIASASPVGNQRERERAPESVVPPPASAPQVVAAAEPQQDESAAREMECRKIDEQIAAIDARLRQPYQAQEGDWWKEQRKKLNDRRFSLRC